eukprot:Gb_11761 [translate_table: standard]
MKDFVGKTRYLQISSPLLKSADLKERLCNIVRILFLISRTREITDDDLLHAAHDGLFLQIYLVLRLSASKRGFQFPSQRQSHQSRTEDNQVILMPAKICAVVCGEHTTDPIGRRRLRELMHNVEGKGRGETDKEAKLLEGRLLTKSCCAQSTGRRQGIRGDTFFHGSNGRISSGKEGCKGEDNFDDVGTTTLKKWLDRDCSVGDARDQPCHRCIQVSHPCSQSVRFGNVDAPFWAPLACAQVPHAELALFTTFIREIILYCKESASKEEMVNATKIANAHPFIDSLPNNYEMMVGEKGVEISIGKKQQLPIASGVEESISDAKSESDVQEALEREMEERTCIVVTHRFSSINNVSIIIVLKDGRIVEQDSHVELLSRIDSGYH